MRFWLLLLCVTGAATADTLPESDNGPLTGIYGLADIEEGAQLLDAGQFRTHISLFTASHAVVDRAGDEQLVIDGESIRAEIDLRLGLHDGVEVGLEIPYVTHQSGGLDSLIDTWHDIFQLPDGSRDDRPQDLLEFFYTNPGGEILSFTDGARGLGDIRIYGGFDISSNNDHRRALRFGIKLPTGDADKLLGSGGTDFSLGLAGDIASFDSRPQLSAFYRAGLVYLSKPEFLANRYEDYVLQLAGGFGFRLNDRWQLNAQASYRSAAYDADVEQLGDSLLTLTFGGNIRLSRLLVLSLGVSEDIKVNSAPDVSFNIRVSHRPLSDQ